MQEGFLDHIVLLDMGYHELIDGNLVPILVESWETGELERPKYPTLLDGKGRVLVNPSEETASWVLVPLSDAGNAKNSAGERFDPNVTIEDFFIEAGAGI